MKSIPELFEDIISKNLNVHASWLPITNTIQLGDYGIISNGVFVPQGNIVTEFGIQLNIRNSPDAKIDFTSTGARITKLVAGAKVNVIPSGAINASIQFDFKTENSFIVKSPTIEVSAISNVKQVADQLKNIDSWRAKYKVVFQVYKAQSSVVMATIDKDTSIIFSGDAKALDKLELGNAGINFTSTKTLALEVSGKDGVIGIGMFRVKVGFLGGGGVEITRGATKSKKSVEIEYMDKKLKNDF